MIRRLITVLVVAVGTAMASLWWLHDGDLGAAVDPELVEWDAVTLARDAGVEEAPGSAAPEAREADAR